MQSTWIISPTRNQRNKKRRRWVRSPCWLGCKS